MEAHAQKIELTLEAGPWCEKATELLAPALPFVGVESVRDQVQAGVAVLFYVMHEGEKVGAYVSRVDHAGDIAEGVIVAAGGKLRGVDLAPLILPEAEKQFRGVSAIRIHTARPGLVRRLVAAGYGPQEFVMRKEITQ